MNNPEEYMPPRRIRDEILRCHKWLDRTVEAIRDGRWEDVEKNVEMVPAWDLRTFVMYLAMHVERDLDVMKWQQREHMSDVLARDTPSQN